MLPAGGRGWSGEKEDRFFLSPKIEKSSRRWRGGALRNQVCWVDAHITGSHMRSGKAHAHLPIQVSCSNRPAACTLPLPALPPFQVTEGSELSLPDSSVMVNNS